MMTTTLSEKSGKGKIDGVVSELTTFFHVRPGHEAAMRAAVEGVDQMLHESARRSCRPAGAHQPGDEAGT